VWITYGFALNRWATQAVLELHLARPLGQSATWRRRSYPFSEFGMKIWMKLTSDDLKLVY